MPELQFDSPLKWPAHILQTDRLKRGVNSQFKMGMGEQEAVTFLQDEVNRTPEIYSAKLTCNALHINSPMPTQYISKHPGASLVLRLENQAFTLCCDKWQTLAHNIYALHLAVRQFRQIAEWGVGSLPVLLQGFSESFGATAAAASPSSFGSSGGMAGWQQVLGLGANATLEDANAVYRTRAKAIAESDPEALQALNLAIQEARKHFGGGIQD